MGQSIAVKQYYFREAQILEYYMDNPQNLPDGTSYVGSFNMALVSMVSDMAKSKPKTQNCFCEYLFYLSILCLTNGTGFMYAKINVF